MHEMKLRVQVMRPASRRSRAARMEPCHWSEGRHNYVGVSLQEMRATMQVMLGVSLPARWDATLVIIPFKQCRPVHLVSQGEDNFTVMGLSTVWHSVDACRVQKKIV